MSCNAKSLILAKPPSAIHNIGLRSGSDKPWARQYPAIKTFQSHTRAGQDDVYYDNLDKPFNQLEADDHYRLGKPAVALNKRLWELDSEADCENYFNTEVISPVLAAWYDSPGVLQTSHAKPNLGDAPENIDCVFSVYLGERRHTVAIGEIKRNLLKPEQWVQGRLTTPDQEKLSKELRGYAHKYQCPQIFCFDGAYLILLQFRASTVDQIADANCPVECVTMSLNRSAYSLRFGLYRLLAAGWRRCQGESVPAPLSIGGFTSSSRQLFTGLPIWKYRGREGTRHPGGYSRWVEKDGAIKWLHPTKPVEMETTGFWRV